ncbi:phage integrase SAM-like domain-containing protein [Spirosoma sp.]|uniref:tyrosine-type recombinase/integrase n=1 Tax=Spirosoma sp. TaxID=1899569 RepID=UPI00261FEC89|nr:phage integrase SAM-like domain-containing protein [Spirosoma sp.]MCX6218378.1 phage integrase SAM-like domain-containing protein [Spirosoma sp.]
MPITVRFCKRKNYTTLQIRITVDGVEGSPFSTVKNKKTIQIDGLWDQKKQKRTDRTQAAIDFNDQLNQIDRDIRAIHKRQLSVNFPATPKSIQLEYQRGEKPEQLAPLPVIPQNTLLKAYRDKIHQLQSYKGTENQLSGSTIEKWEYGLTYLEEYLIGRGESHLKAEHVSVGWAKDYHLHLMKIGPMSADSATRYVKRISDALDSLVDYRTIEFNPLAHYKFGRAKTKDVFFLEKEHLRKFWQLDNRGKGGECIWWMGLVLLTGLDYPDAVRYVQNRQAYDKPGNKRPSIVIRRSKPPKAECKIPVWPELTALLEFTPAGEPPTADEINAYMRGVEVLIGFDERFTLKIGRKTAGYIFLLRGYTIRAVSRILGHSSIAITERYYVKVTSELVDQETDNL